MTFASTTLDSSPFASCTNVSGKHTSTVLSHNYINPLHAGLVLSTTRGFVTHAGVSAERRKQLEDGLMKAMGHSLYQAYLMNSGLDSTSPQPSGAWGEQIKSMVGEFGPALKEMGLVK